LKTCALEVSTLRLDFENRLVELLYQNTV